MAQAYEAGRKIHVLHISRTGGSAIGEALSPIASAYCITLHHHRTTLRDIPQDERVLFFLREPVSRFVSAFNTRLRRGRPRNDAIRGPWEERAFARFSTPNDLAEALASEDAARAGEAREAMHAIEHVKMHATSWLESIDYVRSRRSSIVLLGLQRHLATDFTFLKKELGLPEALALPGDSIGMHRTPDGFSTTLTAAGAANIAQWYREDVAFYRAYQRLRAQWFGLATDPDVV